MQAEETALFAGFQHQPGLSAQLAHFFYAVYVNVAMSREIDQWHLYVVEKPSHRRRLRRHVPKDQPAARPQHSVYAVKEILDIRVVVKALAADYDVEGIVMKCIMAPMSRPVTKN